MTCGDGGRVGGGVVMMVVVAVVVVVVVIVGMYISLSKILTVLSLLEKEDQNSEILSIKWHIMVWETG
ncbi:hypothetical protein E2C01_037976 [Portunus trituberculatus]|uniref:Transmembrane protein n=1 Tax=Portunus trituberculatus TaxID=210409 RepID=A0A5B7FIM8_PORTR|nr:hypothetical protein [Portunus trituberculatus]